MVEVSIIIPTLNEEKHLPVLLQSLHAQTFKDFEIIVADHQSKDKTRVIAKKYKCKIVSGGLPAQARNTGAKAAKGTLLLFIDADSYLGPKALERLLHEFKRRKLDAASVFIRPLRGKPIDKVLHGLINSFVFITQWFYPHGYGAFILCRKKVFSAVRGFDTSIKVAEDHHFVSKIYDYGFRFRILYRSSISTSIRRLEAEGRWRIAKQLFLIGLHRIFIGELRKMDLGYSFKYRKFKYRKFFFRKNGGRAGI